MEAWGARTEGGCRDRLRNDGLDGRWPFERFVCFFFQLLIKNDVTSYHVVVLLVNSMHFAPTILLEPRKKDLIQAALQMFNFSSELPVFPSLVIRFVYPFNRKSFGEEGLGEMKQMKVSTGPFCFECAVLAERARESGAWVVLPKD